VSGEGSKPVLLGRRDECEQLDGLLGEVREGRTRTLIIHGEAGVGKTTLLEYAIATATDFRVVRVAGVEAETSFDLAALHQVLLPFLPRLDALPVPQRRALSRVFGRTGGPVPDRFLVGLASLTLLADAAVEQPLLVVLDDAQALDQASTTLLAFIARRLDADRVAILVAFRDPVEQTPWLEEIPELHLSGLQENDARALLASAGLAEPSHEQALATAAGNPLALVELASAAALLQAGGPSAWTEPLPIGDRLQEYFLRRVLELPTDSQELLLLAAVERHGDGDLILRAAAKLAIADQAAGPLEAERLLTFQPSVGFRHPLIRSAVYHGASPPRRQRAHAALAAALGPDEADRRAWHRAAASPDLDEDVAGELEASAVRARDRGGYRASAALLVRAAELTPDADRRRLRFVHAASDAFAAGAPAVAKDLLEKAVPGLNDPVVWTEVRLLEAQTQFALGESSTVPAALVEVAKALEPLDVSRARATLLDAWMAALYAGRSAGEADERSIYRLARGIPRPPQMPEAPADLLLDGIALLDVDYPAGVLRLRRAIQACLNDKGAEEEDLRLVFFASQVAIELWDEQAQQALAARAVGSARRRGALTLLLPALGYQSLGEIQRGQFAAAETTLAQGDDLAEAIGSKGFFGAFDRLPLLVWRGDERRARVVAAAAMRESVVQGQGGRVTSARAALAILELGLGNYEAARLAAQPVYDEDPFYFGTVITPDLIEAAARSDARELAVAALKRLSTRARASGTPKALGLLARSSALLANNADAEPLYAAAVEHLRRSHALPELARAHLLFGEWLRHRQRRHDARDQLRTAYELFDSIGANAFAARARVELLATGERPRRRAFETRDELTPQEAAIARLVSEGGTNREIAARLFISPSTVDYHLRKVFRKLGVKSRTELARVLLQAPPSEDV
jgi:DNA-binding CsgD family transcriptional regulator/nucleoside-triphosphatase THEP1